MRRRNGGKVTAFLCFLASVLALADRVQGQRSSPDSTPGKPEAYVVPFSHLDRFWAGTGEECLARGNRVIAKAIKLSKQYPQFRFLIESDNFLANFVETHPGSQELEDLKRLVKTGRVEISPIWANIFHNIPDGEVHARNLLYGKAYARAVFGVAPRVLHPADIPGFTPQFPQILDKADVPFMVMTRLGPTDKSLFHWQSPDGSKVLVWNAIRGYAWGAGSHMDLHNDLTEAKIDSIRKELEAVHGTAPGPLYVHWGVDLWAPSEKVIENVDTLNHVFRPGYFALATPQEFFDVVEKTPNLNDVSGEIPLGWPHVVDSIAQLWQLAVPATNTLKAAEEFAAINYALGYADYPQQELEVLWKRVIESMDHNHDGQGGQIGDDRKKEYSLLAMIRGGEILRDMQRNIAERVQIPIAKSFPIVVFNRLGWQRDDVVKAHLTLYGDVIPSAIADYKRGMRLVDETGKAIPFYIERSSENISRALELVFAAQGVPALGYKTYFLVPAEQTESVPATSRVSLDREKDLQDPRRSLGVDVMENQFYRVTVDKVTGSVTVFDKQLSRDVCKDMAMIAAEERGSNNVQPEKDTGRSFPLRVAQTVVEENNPVRTVLKISGEIAGIAVVQRLTLYQNLKRLEIENHLDWRRPPLVRIEQLFPLQQQDPEIYYGIPFGVNSATNVMPGSGPRFNDELNREAWQKYRIIQDWVFAGTSEWGLTLAADHQLVRFDPGLIRAAMLRATRYTSVRVVQGDEVTSIHYPPEGSYVFKYSLSSGPGDWKQFHSYRAGLDFNNPLLPVSVADDISSKSLPPTQSFCAVPGDNLVISALKKSEADRSIVLRLYEIQGDKAETSVTWLGKQSEFRETSLLEQDIHSQEQRVLRLNPYEIKTLKLQAGQKAEQ